MPTRKILSIGEIKLGDSLPWDLYNNSGRILFKKGIILNTDASLQRLAKLELYYDLTDDFSAPDSQIQPKLTPITERPNSQEDIFRIIEDCVLDWKEFLDDRHATDSELSSMLSKLTEKLSALYAPHPDTCIATINFLQKYPAALVQPIFSYFLCCMGQIILNLESKQLESFRNAALTANISTYRLQEKLDRQASPLTQDQKDQLRNHPLKSAETLKRLGISDPLWLKIVTQHHERSDGSGYPRGLKHDEICIEAQYYCVVDTYLAQVSSKAHRKKVDPFLALQNMDKMIKSENRELLEAFISELNFYPPGTLVSLHNEEIGVVSARNSNDLFCPEVISFMDSAEQAFNLDKVRDTSNPRFGITGAYLGKLPKSIDLENIFLKKTV